MELSKREAVERRAWRLAALLTGSSVAADRVTESALASQPRLADLPRARVERLIILRAREWSQRGARFGAGSGARGARSKVRPAALLERLRSGHRAARGDGESASRTEAPERALGDAIFGGEAEELVASLRALERQPLEAWVLHELDGEDMIETAQAMDCSRSAVSRHLSRAREALEASLGDELGAATEALRAQADRLDPGAFTDRRRARRRRRRMRLVIGAALAIGVIGAAVAATWWALGA